MNRYLVYLVTLNMLANIVSQVSLLLFEDRFNGSVSSILLSIPIGAVAMIVFVKLFDRFPNQGLSEIVGGALPRWIGAPFLLLQAFLWFVCGSVILLYIAEVAKRFMNPDFAPAEALVLFLIVVVLFANMPSNRILYMLEIIMLLSVPFIAFIIGKAIFSDSLLVSSMMEVATHALDMPSLMSFCASMFMYSGFMCLCVFNRVISPKPKRMWYLSALMLTGSITLLITFFLPIGFHGADGILEWTYPWFVTADSLRLQYGFIERVLFFFLLLYVLISVISVIVYWHIGLDLLKSSMPRFRSSWLKVVVPYCALAAISLASIYIDLNVGLRFLRTIARIWMLVQLPNTLLVLAVLAGAAYLRTRRQRRGTRDESI
ncbi:hypothetical protein FE782_09935 [Paenibacillus antri]|uniref:GerAB/ArcD/ProY family transporter n=1 Tax=Paenibacillus antri TaxID=2582848 RepID=A0A5R9GD79_9BACL|nr:GerAB/ArcD/ProY family transporter [Paenibacillus antri]TLS52286.1 hypothetical protein FE782_09935 [Paenibacillus antri]